MTIQERLFPELLQFPDSASREFAWRTATSGTPGVILLFSTPVIAVGSLMVAEAIRIRAQAASTPTFAPSLMAHVAQIVGPIASLAGLWAFRRRIRFRLRGELWDVGVRLCQQCGYGMPIPSMVRCAECGAEVPPLRAAIASVSPDGFLSVEIAESRSAEGGFEARISSVQSGATHLPFGYRAPLGAVTLNWDLPGSVLGVSIAGECYLLVRWGQGQHGNPEIHTFGVGNKLTSADIESFCASQCTRESA